MGYEKRGVFVGIDKERGAIVMWDRARCLPWFERRREKAVKILFTIVFLITTKMPAASIIFRELEDLSEQIVAEIKTTPGKKIAVMDFILNEKVTPLSESISDYLLERFSRMEGLNVMNKELRDTRLKQLKVTPAAVYALDSEELKELGVCLTVDFLILGEVYYDPVAKRGIELYVEIISSETGKRCKSFVTTLHRTQQLIPSASEFLKRETARRLPGRLIIVTSPPGAEVYVDDALKGQTNKDGFIYEIPPGFHMIEIKKGGYPPLAENLIVEEGEERNISVKYINRPFAPLGSALKSCLLGTIHAGPAADERGALGAVYSISWLSSFGMGVVYILDRLFCEEENFLTDECRESYQESRKRVLNGELITAAGSYLVSGLCAFIIGLRNSPPAKDVITLGYNASVGKFKIGLIYSK